MKQDRRFLDLAARLALRYAGFVEPNPVVGCAVVRNGILVGMGAHQRFGGLHAERQAFARMRESGIDTRGCTLYVTLEPCNGHGKQPPCVQAIIEAGIREVIYAAKDPNPLKAGGAEALEQAGISTRLCEESPLASGLVAPFIKTMKTGLPWVIAKWAQTIDGRVATRTGESKWISSEAARRRVHRLRARVDAIVTGIGTVAADDPMLTARSVRVRRVARRIIVDTDLDISPTSRMVATARQYPTTVVCAGELLGAAITARKCGQLREAGVELIGASHCADGRRLDLREIMRELVTRYVTTNVMVECGPGLMGSFLAADLIDEARVYVAPMMLGDEMAHAVATGRIAESLTAARRFNLASVEAVDGDVELIYRRSAAWLTETTPRIEASAAQRP